MSPKFTMNFTADFDNSSDNFTINSTRPWVSMVSQQRLTEWLAVSLTICACGTVSYVGLFAIICSERSLRTGAGVLLLHLIITEALVATIHFYLFCTDSYRSQTGIVSDHRFCFYMMFSYWVTLFASNWSAAFLSMNRLVAVAKPHFYRHLTTMKIRCAMIIGSWTLAFAAAAPFAAGFGGRYESMLPLGACTIARTGLQPGTEHVYDGVTTVGMYLPLGLTLSIYIGLFTVMKSNYGQKKLSSHLQTAGEQQAGRTISRRLGMARMLFASSIWYCVCFCPIPIMMTFVPQVFSKYPVALFWLRTLLFTGFSTKPIMYCSLNAEYRDILRKVFQRRVHKPNAELSRTTVQPGSK